MLIGVVGILSLLLRNSAPVFRYWLWSIVVIRLCIPLRVHFPFDISGPGAMVHGVSETIAPVLGGLNAARMVSFLADPTALVHLTPLYARALASAWFIVAGILVFVLGIRLFLSHRVLRKGTLVGREDLQKLLDELRRMLKIRRTVRLYYSNLDSNSGPSLLGVFHPRILLPRSIAETWSAEEIRPILIHELIHVKRYDPLFNWIQGIVQIVYFFHPLVWLVNSRIRALREESCDDLSVLYLDNKSKRYSECLYNAIQESSRGSMWRMAEAGFAERKNSLARRIVRILDKEYEVRVRIGVRSATSLLLIGIVGFTISCDSIVGVGEEKGSEIATLQNNGANAEDEGNPYSYLRKSSREDQDIVVVVTTEKVVISNEQVSPEKLESTLSQLLEKSKHKRIIVQFTPDTPNSSTEIVYQAAFNAGAKRITIVGK